MGVTSEKLLLPATSPPVVVPTATRLVMLSPRNAVLGRTTICTVCCAPLAMLPRLQMTLLLPLRVSDSGVGVVVQLPVEGVAETKTSPSGKVSSIVTFSAVLRPSGSVFAVTT